jgi:hypothetical protein
MANEETTMNLQNSVRVNGILYPRGMGVKIPKEQADDIARIDYEATEQKNNLVKQRQYVAQAGQDPVL